MAGDDIDALRGAATEMMRATKAAEPGCLEYAFALDLAEPGLLREDPERKDQGLWGE